MEVVVENLSHETADPPHAPFVVACEIFISNCQDLRVILVRKCCGHVLQPSIGTHPVFIAFVGMNRGDHVSAVSYEVDKSDPATKVVENPADVVHIARGFFAPSSCTLWQALRQEGINHELEPKIRRRIRLSGVGGRAEGLSFVW